MVKTIVQDNKKLIILSGSDLRKLERGDILTVDDITISVNHLPDDDEHRTNQARPGDKVSW